MADDVFFAYSTTNQIIESIIKDLDSGCSQFMDILKQRELAEPDAEFGQIVRGQHIVLSRFPAIRVIYDSKNVNWYAVGVRREVFSFFIDCMTKIKTKDKQVMEELVTVLGSVVLDWLNRWDRLQFVVGGDRKAKKFTVGDSFASSMAKGYTEDGLMRIARINYSVSVFNPVYAY